jgi:hypothetical protein
LPDHTRHQVKLEDYPGILPYSRSKLLLGRDLDAEERCVRGTLVVGLSNSDLDALDVFEGDEYVRQSVIVYPLEPLASLSESSAFQAESLDSAAPPPAPAPFQLADPVEAESYIYDSLSHLKADLWSFDDFLKNKAWKWV